jgi:hypothetical protein
MFHTFHVRRKETGVWETERAIHKGDPPKPDDVIEANLNGKMVKALIGEPTSPVTAKSSTY